MSGTFYNLNTKYNWLLALFNSLPSASDIMTLSTNQIVTGIKTFIALPQSATAPVINNELCNKLYVDTVAGGGGGGENLNQTLVIGNDAGALSITNVNDIGLTTINGAAYPPTIPSPVDINVTDTTNPVLMYPMLAQTIGVTPPEIITISHPFSVIPSSGQIQMTDTLYIEGVGGARNVAIGDGAGSSISGGTTDTVAIGGGCGATNQQNGGIGIGNRAAQTFQGINSIAIGASSGRSLQGSDAIAIGAGAGNISQHRNSVIISALGVLNPLNSNGNFACFIAPIRGVALGIGVGVMNYDPTTFEVQYSTT